MTVCSAPLASLPIVTTTSSPCKVVVVLVDPANETPCGNLNRTWVPFNEYGDLLFN